jgi:hypothetical protein
LGAFEIIELIWQIFSDNRDLLITLVGSPVVVAIGARFYSIFQLRRVYQIKSADDGAIAAIEQIQERIFPKEECDPPGFLSQKIEDSHFDILGRPRSNQVMICLYYRKGRRFHGYLSAEYFVDTKTIFFWYLVNLRRSDSPYSKEKMGEEAEDLGPDHYDTKVAVHLIKKLSRICNGIDGPWRQMIAEVDSSQVEEAVKRVSQFQRYSRTLRRSTWRGRLIRLFKPTASQRPQVFKADMDFKMPLHDPGLLYEASRHETAAWLVIAPQAPMEHKDGGPELDKARIGEIFESLVGSYRDKHEPRFNEYISRFYADLLAKLPERVRLVSERTLLAARPAARTTRKSTKVT